MSDCMTFPDTAEEFMEQYKVVDTDGIYMSKGAELVPIFRMRQWFEHLPSAQPKVDCQKCVFCGFSGFKQFQAAQPDIKGVIDESGRIKFIEQPERKKGKWRLADIQNPNDKANGNYLYFCSNCFHADLHAKTQEVPYCWYCGAEMEGLG